MGITNPGFKFSNSFDLNYTSSRFYHQTYLAWVTLSGELNLQPVQLCRSLRHIRLFYLVKVIVNGKDIPCTSIMPSYGIFALQFTF